MEANDSFVGLCRINQTNQETVFRKFPVIPMNLFIVWVQDYIIAAQNIV